MKLIELKECLYAIFGEHGQIIDIVAMKTPPRRGQAFIVFKEISSAVIAMRNLQGYPFFGKSLVSLIYFNQRFPS